MNWFKSRKKLFSLPGIDGRLRCRHYHICVPSSHHSLHELHLGPSVYLHVTDHMYRKHFLTLCCPLSPIRHAYESFPARLYCWDRQSSNPPLYSRRILGTSVCNRWEVTRSGGSGRPKNAKHSGSPGSYWSSVDATNSYYPPRTKFVFSSMP